MEFLFFLLVGALVGLVFAIMQSTTRNLEQSPSLHVAAESGYVESIERLIVDGADVNARRHGCTKMHTDARCCRRWTCSRHASR